VGRRLPILTFHSLDHSGSPLSVSPPRFRSLMEWLRDAGWRTLTIDQLLSGQAEGKWPPRCLLLTFDDGLESFAKHGLPVLKECDFTATLFVVAGRVGKTNDWPGQPSWVPRWRLLDWDGLRRVASEGMELGAHTLTHPLLTALTADEGRREILEGKRVIEDRLGRPVRTFAYPYGARSAALESLVATSFRAGFGTRLGFASPDDRVSAFHRIDMYYLRDPRLFSSLGAVWMHHYLRFRRWVRELKDRQGGRG